jgi:hypothetical protein
LQLPCNADLIESVHLPIIDAQITTPVSDFDHDAVYFERYIESDKKRLSPFYISGKFAHFERIGDKLYFD